MDDLPSWAYLLVGLFGAGTIGVLATLVANRGKTSAEAESIRVGTLDQVVQTLSRRVDDLTKEVGRLEGRLDRTESERDWWRERTHQLETYIVSMNMPVPHPVTTPATKGNP